MLQHKESHLDLCNLYGFDLFIQGISFMQVDDYERRQTLVNLKMFKDEDFGGKTRNTISIKECEGASESKRKSKNQVERTKERKE